MFRPETKSKSRKDTLNSKVKAKKYIYRLRTSALAIVEDSTISFSNKLTEIIKLHQVCNGFTKDDDGKILKLHDSKNKCFR